jgi:protein arginine kinase activator
MKCDKCDNPAVVHEVMVRNGVKREIHLCAKHAQDAGIELPGNPPINQVLTQFVLSKSAKASGAKTATRTCTSCGMSLADFRQHGVLGCPECYVAFGDQLSPLIERAQNGGTHHCGRTPRRCGGTIDRQLQLRRLMKELDDAVASEQYERAAELRDRLTALESTEVAEAGDRGERSE